MSLSHYFIFLACVLIVDIAVLYGCFFVRETRDFDNIRNETFSLSMPEAYPIQAACLLAASAALFFFIPDKAWMWENRMPQLGGLCVFCALTGCLPVKRRAAGFLVGLLELAAVGAFVFFLPDNGLWEKTPYPPQIVRAAAALVWFGVFKFMTSLRRSEGIVAIQSFFTGFAALAMLVLVPFAVPLLQTGGVLLILIFLTVPLYYVLDCDLSMNRACAGVFCMFSTGFAVLTALNGKWSVSCLLLSYVLFELVCVCYRFLKNTLLRRAEPLMFADALQDRGASAEHVHLLIIRYHLFMFALILFVIFTDIQLQAVILAVLLYWKLYFNIMTPASKTSFVELYRQVKRDSKNGLAQTAQVIDQLKEKYQKKPDGQKDSTDEQQS